MENGAAGIAARKDRINVAVRFRPLSDKEHERGDHEVWKCEGNTVGIIEDVGMDVKFAYDHVFPAGFSNQGVYEEVASSIVQSSLDGINGTIFAYGVTSSGKTHTMMGDDVTPGIVPHAISEVFHLITKLSKRKEFVLKLSMLEIYNEIVNDLLDPANNNLRLREDPRRGVYVEGVREERLASADHALHVVATGNENRKTSATAFNEGSSRSHTIIRLAIEVNERPEFAEDPNARVGRTMSYLTMVDLAGSESAKAEVNRSQRVEGSFINKSLLTLSTVIHKLSEGGAVHIPFRDSKLTRILSNSLTGNGARMAVICTITPASTQAEETHNTLKFASRAKQIAIEAKRNEILDQSSLIARYQQELALLRHQLDIVMREGGGGGGDGGGAESTNFEVMSLREKFEEEHMAVVEGERERERLAGRVERLTQCVLDSHFSLAQLEHRLREVGGEVEDGSVQAEADAMRRQVVALAEELRERERALRTLAAGGVEMAEEDVTMQVMLAEREYMQMQVQEIDSRNAALALALERLRRLHADALNLDPESIDLEALVAGELDDATGTVAPQTAELEAASLPLRRGYDHTLAQKVLKIEEKVRLAIDGIQRREEKFARQREVHRTLAGMEDAVHNRVANLTAENQNLKKELERVEAHNEQLNGYMVDHLGPEELYELIKKLTSAVDRVRITVMAKKLALSSGGQAGKMILLSSPEQRAARSKMSIEEMGRAIADLKDWGNSGQRKEAGLAARTTNGTADGTLQ